MHSLYSSLMRHIWSPVSRSGFSRTRKTSTYWSESCKTSQRAFRIQAEAERVLRESSGWRRVSSEGFYQCVSIPDGGSKANGVTLLSATACAPTRGNGQKLQYGKFHVNVRKSFFTERVVMVWNKLPREVVEYPFLE